MENLFDDLPPWEALSPEINRIRLCAFMGLMVAVHNRVAAERRRQDGNWSTHCRLYDWRNYTIWEAANGVYSTWLFTNCEAHDLDFEFHFGGAYGLGQRRLRHAVNKSLGARNSALEQAIDAGRSSSRLTERGTTDPSDSI